MKKNGYLVTLLLVMIALLAFNLTRVAQADPPIGNGSAPQLMRPPAHYHYKVLEIQDAQIEQLSEQGWVIRGAVACPSTVHGMSAGNGSAPSDCVMLQQPY